MKLTWSQPNPERNSYWETDKYDFWISCSKVYSFELDRTRDQWFLFNGDHELGVYDTLEEAQDAAEPAHGVNEAPEDTPVCYWCSGSHPGRICEFAPYYVESKVNP